MGFNENASIYEPFRWFNINTDEIMTFKDVWASLNK